MMTFGEWLDIFVDEKGWDPEQIFEVEGPIYGLNLIPLACVMDALKLTSSEEQMVIKRVIVRLDFQNADCLGYFRHLAQALAI